MAGRGINKVILIGNLGQDPETRTLPSNDTVANISLATNETWKDKNSGEQQTRTEWHKVTFFGRLAEVVGQYLRKGSMIYVEGSLRTRKWQDQNGNDRWTTEIRATDMQMLGDRSESGADRPPSPPPEGTTQRLKPGPEQKASASDATSAEVDFEDDIPF